MAQMRWPFFGLGEDDAPVIGSPEYALGWHRATWHFASAENRATFEANPEAWLVVEGRLFLNYSRRIRRRWLREILDAIGQGDANYPAMLG